MREGEEGKQGQRRTKEPALDLLCPEKPQHKLQWMVSLLRVPVSSRLPPRAREETAGVGCWCLRAPAGKSQGTLGVWGHPIKGGSETANGGDRGKGREGGGEGAAEPLALLPALT